MSDSVSSSSVAIRVALTMHLRLVRDALSKLIDTAGDITTAAVYASADALVGGVGRSGIDVCIIEVGLPGMGGLEALRRLRLQGIQTPVLMTCVQGNSALASRCVQDGAHGFVTMDVSDSEFLDAIRSVERGRVYLSTEHLDSVVQHANGCAGGHMTLSPQEFQVFTRLARGFTNGEISRELHLDQRTVSSYRRRVLDKMGFTRNAELVEYAIRQGLIDEIHS
jgi:two-component system, NarL family, invasion response regulator UvrY